MRPAGAEHTRALADALVAAGAPADVAATLAQRATLEECEGTPMLCVDGHCTELGDAPDDATYEHVAENVAADNAEAHDRQQRGEVGWTPMWPLPERQPRA